MRITLQSVTSFFVLLVVLVASVHADVKDPRAVVETATNGITSELKNLTPEQRTDVKVRELVLTWVVPIIDQERVAMGALSKHWRSATPAQRKAFIELYRDLQIRTYSGAFKAFNGEQFSFENAVYNETGDRAIVKGTMKQADGKLVPIDFRLYQRDKNSPWLVYDAVVAGLGMVKTYRDQLNERLQNTSLEKLLQELSAQVAN